jgi:hypothetical protein
MCSIAAKEQQLQGGVCCCRQAIITNRVFGQSPCNSIAEWTCESDPLPTRHEICSATLSQQGQPIALCSTHCVLCSACRHSAHHKACCATMQQEYDGPCSALLFVMFCLQARCRALVQPPSCKGVIYFELTHCVLCCVVFCLQARCRSHCTTAHLQTAILCHA